MKKIIKDIELRLNINIDENDIHIFNEGKTDALVFSIKDKYLIKKTTKEELDIIRLFLLDNKNDYFQKLIYINYELSYACLSFLKGNKFNDDLDIDYLINVLYDITSNYREIDYDGYGYLYSDHKTWVDFLNDEVDYSTDMIKDEKLNITPVKEALKVVSKVDVPQYLIHGDFGTHNFITNDNKLYVIDPMGVVGDPIYDFYFSIMSSSYIFTKINYNKLLEFFDRDIEYKKAMMIISFYIRLCRTYKYDKDEYPIYVEYYNNLIKE